MMTTIGKINYFCFAVCLSFVFISSANAASQSHADIKKTAQRFLTAHVFDIYKINPKIKMGNLDKRLKLTRCNKSLETYLPKGSRTLGNITVGVKCSGSKPWSLHVPASVSLYINVLVSSQPLTRGTVLAPGDVKQNRYDLAKLANGYFTHASQSVGMKLKRSISAGTALTPAMVKKPQIIKRGQQVTMLARAGRMEVRTTGKALANGAIGDRIAVINLSSKQKLEGIITANGEIQIDL